MALSGFRKRLVRSAHTCSLPDPSAFLVVSAGLHHSCASISTVVSFHHKSLLLYGPPHAPAVPLARAFSVCVFFARNSGVRYTVPARATTTWVFSMVKSAGVARRGTRSSTPSTEQACAKCLVQAILLRSAVGVVYVYRFHIREIFDRAMMRRCVTSSGSPSCFHLDLM